MKNKEQLKQLKELAKEAYNSNDVCDEWKEKIEQVLPELKQKLEVGKWYSGYRDYVVFITKIKKEDGYNKLYYYGFSYDWFDDDYIASNEIESSLRPATKEEVEKALIKEAKKRGYNNNNSKCLVLDTRIISDDYYFKYRDSEEDLVIQDNTSLRRVNVIYKKGKWSEIIEDPTTKAIEVEPIKEIEINGIKYTLTPKE